METSDDDERDSATAAEGAVALERVTERHQDIDVEGSDIADADEQDVSDLLTVTGLEMGARTLDAVRWHSDDAEQPDYCHLEDAPAHRAFTFTAQDLETLIAANEFFIRPGKVLFGLRGAKLVGEAHGDVPALQLKDQRPDHRAFRCVIGVYDRTTQTMSAFTASTVPNAAYVFRCHALAKQGVPQRSLTGNILPTGCYIYTVGTHKRGKKGEIPGVLRLSTTSTGASEVLVLRSVSDVVYDRRDPFMVAAPGDNIHPGQLASGFSSAGCLTLPGRYARGAHAGTWNEFRRAAALIGAEDGQQFSMVLLTGLDAAAAAQARTTGAGTASLYRLRHGSRGPRVAALQKALGLTPDASMLVGPVTRRELARRQNAVLGWADGIYAPAMDRLLGMNVYGDG
jgi:hypothetical protein